jgi:hypothetical protein
MPNPATLHHRSIKIDHHLKLADFYIHAGCPQIFLPEPNFKLYKPDVYMKNQTGNAMCVEVQITPISTKRMQSKIDEFVSSYGKDHDATHLLIVSNQDYPKITIPSSFKLHRINLPVEPYTKKSLA